MNHEPIRHFTKKRLGCRWLLVVHAISCHVCSIEPVKFRKEYVRHGSMIGLVLTSVLTQFGIPVRMNCLPDSCIPTMGSFPLKQSWAKRTTHVGLTARDTRLSVGSGALGDHMGLVRPVLGLWVMFPWVYGFSRWNLGDVPLPKSHVGGTPGGFCLLAFERRPQAGLRWRRAPGDERVHDIAWFSGVVRCLGCNLNGVTQLKDL